MFTFQFFDQIRRELVANSVHTTDATQLVGVVYCAFLLNRESETCSLLVMCLISRPSPKI